MNSSACILQCINPQELAQKQLESQTKKKEKNQRYYQKKKQELEELDKLKVQLGVKQLDLQGIQNAITVRDQMILTLQLENKRKEEEYINILRNKDAEIETLRKELEKQNQDINRERIIADVGQQIALLNAKISNLEVSENRVKHLEKKLQEFEGRYFLVEKFQYWYPKEITEAIIRLQNERLTKPLYPPSLDKLIAETKVYMPQTGQSPPPITKTTIGMY